jgi:predicted nucleic acid-binding Zn ribbon protein
VEWGGGGLEGCRRVALKWSSHLPPPLHPARPREGHCFNVHRHAKTGRWYAQITLRGVEVNTRQHKQAWQAAADLEWQLARWCAHTGELRSHYVSNAARLVELGRADAAGVLTDAVTVTPWELSRWDGGGGKATPAGERLRCARR